MGGRLVKGTFSSVMRCNTAMAIRVVVSSQGVQRAIGSAPDSCGANRGTCPALDSTLVCGVHVLLVVVSTIWEVGRPKPDKVLAATLLV